MEKCPWAKADPLLEAYHDQVWGRPVYNGQKLHELLVLESFQAGLSWLTVLKRYEGLKKAFADFKWQKVAKYSEADVEWLMHDESIIRHRGKIEAAINNARVLEKLAHSKISLYDLIWEEVAYTQVVNHWQDSREVPSLSPASKRLAKKLKKLGFKFLGPTTCYALMQACGAVNDHLETCPCWQACQELG